MDEIGRDAAGPSQPTASSCGSAGYSRIRGWRAPPTPSHETRANGE